MPGSASQGNGDSAPLPPGTLTLGVPELPGETTFLERPHGNTMWGGRVAQLTQLLSRTPPDGSSPSCQSAATSRARR